MNKLYIYTYYKQLFNVDYPFIWIYRNSFIDTESY